MTMYNLLEYSYNYSMTSGNLRNYYRDEINDDGNENNAANNRTNKKERASKSFEYETKLIGSTPNNNNMLDAEVVVQLKYFSNLWRSLDLSLINCEIKLDLSWSKKPIISEISIIPKILQNPDTNSPAQQVATIQTTSATFQINNAKLYVPFIALSINDNIKFFRKHKVRI